MKKIFTASLVAIMAVTAANADIASTKYVTDRTGTTADLTTTAKDLTGAVNELKTAIGTTTTNMDNYQLKSERVTTISGTGDDVTYPTTKAVAGYATTLMEGVSLDVEGIRTGLTNLATTVNNNETDIEGKVSALTTTVNNNKTAADTGIQEAKTAAAAASTAAAKALTDAKTYTDTEVGKIDTAYKAADTAINDKIGTVESGKTVVQMIADAKTAATYDDTALKAKVNANEAAIAKNAEDIAGLDSTYVKDSDFTAFQTTNTTAINAAKKAGDDAQATANANATAISKLGETYATDAELNTAKSDIETAYEAADATTLASAKAYADTAADTAEADAIAAAKTAGDAAYAAKSYEGRVQTNETAISKINIAAADVLATGQGDGQYALTMTKDGQTLTYKWEMVGR